MLDGKFLNSTEAREYCGGVADQTFRHYVRQGLIPAYRIGRRLVFKAEDLRAFVESNPAGYRQPKQCDGDV
jgi:excisionase family DNA binding protein